jgi:hypothetical protein
VVIPPPLPVNPLGLSSESYQINGGGSLRYPGNLNLGPPPGTADFISLEAPGDQTANTIAAAGEEAARKDRHGNKI